MDELPTGSKGWWQHPIPQNLRGSSPKLIREKRQTRPKALCRRLVSGTGFCCNEHFFILHLFKVRGSSCHLSNCFSLLLLTRRRNRKKKNSYFMYLFYSYLWGLCVSGPGSLLSSYTLGNFSFFLFFSNLSVNIFKERKNRILLN